MPTASIAMATAVKPGCLPSDHIAYLRSCINAFMTYASRVMRLAAPEIGCTDGQKKLPAIAAEITLVLGPRAEGLYRVACLWHPAEPGSRPRISCPPWAPDEILTRCRLAARFGSFDPLASDAGPYRCARSARRRRAGAGCQRGSRRAVTRPPAGRRPLGWRRVEPRVGLHDARTLAAP